MDIKAWSEINISDIFRISYGNKLDMCYMNPQKDGIAFVTRTSKNNGIGGYVEKLENENPYPPKCLTVALGGSIGSTFLQKQPFYTSQNVAVLEPKEEVTDSILLLIATLIEKECDKRFIAFGRELNKHINKDFTIKLPILPTGQPDWAALEYLLDYTIIPQLPIKAKGIWNGEQINKPMFFNKISLNNRKWNWFECVFIFSHIEKCKCSNATELLEIGNDIAYIGAKKSENGVMKYAKYDETLVTKGNCIVFIGDGQGSVGYCLYQPKDFIGSSTLVAGYNNHLNPYTALFLVTILDMERYRYSFGRKYNKNAILNSKIKLPVDLEGNPDWQFMEDYIKSLPYSANL